MWTGYTVFMRHLILTFAPLMLVALIAAPTLSVAQQPVAISSNHSPILFGTDWCPYCKAARNWFRANKIAFTNCDVETNTSCRQQYKMLREKFGVKGVPAILYQGQIWGGYDEDQMEEIGELARAPRANPKK
jgi:glutaredoxin